MPESLKIMPLFINSLMKKEVNFSIEISTIYLYKNKYTINKLLDYQNCIKHKTRWKDVWLSQAYFRNSPSFKQLAISKDISDPQYIWSTGLKRGNYIIIIQNINIKYKYISIYILIQINNYTGYN